MQRIWYFDTTNALEVLIFGFYNIHMSYTDDEVLGVEELGEEDELDLDAALLDDDLEILDDEILTEDELPEELLIGDDDDDSLVDHSML